MSYDDPTPANREIDLDELEVISLLDVFLTYETFPQHAESLMQFTDIEMGTETIVNRTNELVNCGLVEKIDDTHPQEYRLNMDHPVSQPMVNLHTELHNHIPEIYSECDGFDTKVWLRTLQDVLKDDNTTGQPLTTGC